MNRMGIANSSAPFHKVSFETALKFIVEASLYVFLFSDFFSSGEVDDLKNPSSRIIVGRPSKDVEFLY